jgi:arginine/lysine/ornithine decarboxylase
MVAAAADAGTPYDTIVLAACSYDGVLYNLHRIMSECLALSPVTAFLVDEAWSAINTFHSGLRSLTALDAAHRIAASGTPITVLVTQSAHKSMSAARQGSYLHVVGEPALIAGVASILYGRHTTSPSIPILASLDLARAHAQSHGQRLLQRSLDLAAGARQAVNDDPALSAYQMLPEPAPPGINRDYLTADPTKLLIGTTGLRRSGQDVRLRLFHDYGIYLSRTLPDAFLVNFHIGIAAEDVNRLLQSLRSLAHRTRRRPGGTRANLGTQDDGTPIDRLLIAYPPGVPLAVPGERWAPTLRQRVAASRRSGAEVYQLPPGPSHHPREHVS